MHQSKNSILNTERTTSHLAYLFIVVALNVDPSNVNRVKIEELPVAYQKIPPDH